MVLGCVALLLARPVLAQPEIDDTADPIEVDECAQKPDPAEMPERIRARVHTTSCRTVRWVDHLFGDEHEFQEEEIGGIISTALSWSEFDGFEPKLRFKLDAKLPNLNRRVNAFLGRVEEDAYIRDTQPDDQTAFRDGIEDEDRSWLLGFGYNKNPHRKQGFDYSAGIRLRAPPDPYVKVRYRYNSDWNDGRDLRFNQTIFWRRNEGFGTTSSLDMAWDLHETSLLRWESIGTVSEDTEGLNWWTGVTWYQNMGNIGAAALLGFVRGETDEPVALQEYGLRLTLRRPWLREWMYLEAGPSLTWPRERRNQQREASLGFAIRVEMEFGAYRR